MIDAILDELVVLPVVVLYLSDVDKSHIDTELALDDLLDRLREGAPELVQ